MFPVALSAALAIRRSLGARAGSAALRPMLSQLSGSARAEALLVSLECARELGDANEYERLSTLWSAGGPTDLFARLAQEALEAARTSQALAVGLARAETDRTPTDARAHYLLARLNGDESAYRAALRHASRPPRQEAVVAASVGMLAALGARLHPEDRIPDDSAEWAPLIRLGLAKAQLQAWRGYRRVRALDTLVALSESPDETVQAGALTLGAEFAARGEPAAIEWDRLRTLMAGHARAPEALARLAVIESVVGDVQSADRSADPLVRAAIALRDGHPLPSHPSASDIAPNDIAPDNTAPADTAPAAEPSESSIPPGASAIQSAGWRALAAIDAYQSGRPVDFTGLENAGEPALALCAIALSSADEALADGAAALASRLVSAGAAHRGWLRAADAANRSGRLELGRTLRARALLADEPGAHEAAAHEGCIEGWAAAARGDEDAALALLSRARDVLR